MESSLEQGIAATFGDVVKSDKRLMDECISMCQIYGMSPEDLLWKLEAFNFKPSAVFTEMSPPITSESIAALKSQLQRELAKKEGVVRTQQKARESMLANVNRSRMPPTMRRQLNVSAASVASSGLTTAVKTEQDEEMQVAGPSTVAFRGPRTDDASRKMRAYRYMHEKVSERSEVLDQIIEDFVPIYRKHYDIAEFVDPSLSTVDDVYVMGRIVHDSDSTPTAKLSENGIVLESSRVVSSGARVPIVFDANLKIRGHVGGAGGIGLFPGAIVALKGKNGGGGYFLATEILAIPPPKPSPIAQGIAIPSSIVKTDGSAFSMCIACGPYTTDANLSYKPWKTLLQRLETNKPNVVLLLGPFVDSAHPIIKVGGIDLTVEKIFNARFMLPLRKFLSLSPGSIVLLVPSIRDIISNHVVYPQAELDSILSATNTHIHFLPNPVRFSVNDVSFAATSVDTVFHIRKEEYIKRGTQLESVAGDNTGADVLANTCRHLLQQRSFYPLFPPPLDLSHDVNLDVSHSDLLRLVDKEDNDYAPDVLVVPGKLKHFVKSVGATTAVNPSFLSKGVYASLNFTGREVPGGLKEQLKVDLIKLEIG